MRKVRTDSWPAAQRAGMEGPAATIRPAARSGRRSRVAAARRCGRGASKGGSAPCLQRRTTPASRRSAPRSQARPWAGPYAGTLSGSRGGSTGSSSGDSSGGSRGTGSSSGSTVTVRSGSPTSIAPRSLLPQCRGQPGLSSAPWVRRGPASAIVNPALTSLGERVLAGREAPVGDRLDVDVRSGLAATDLL
jgi:hypothetical protein